MAQDLQRMGAVTPGLILGASSGIFFLLFILGCGSQPQNQDSAQLAAIRAGRQTMLDTPSPELISQMAADPEAAKAVTDIWFNDTSLSDPQWATADQLASLPGLRLLRFYQTKGTDEFAKVVATFPQVTTLAFHETDLTDEGLKHLAKMAQLEDLFVEFQKGGITDTGLANLTTLKRLKKVRIATDDALTAAKLKSGLPNCNVTVERYSSRSTAAPL